MTDICGELFLEAARVFGVFARPNEFDLDMPLRLVGELERFQRAAQFCMMITRSFQV